MRIGTLTIVGVGLIGGSIGLGARRRGLAGRVIGAGRHAAALERARELGAIDHVCLDLCEAVRRADVAVFCTPVTLIPEQVLAVAPACANGTLLTDAGSTKGAIVRALDGKLPRGVPFVGSHPLAGSEKRGPEHADADLFQGRVTVVTPTPRTDAAAVERTADFWRGLDSRVIVMGPDEHDQALAMTSHLPHLLASALAGILPPQLRPLAATGFRDTTRVAAGDPSIWTGIFLQNRAALIEALGQLQGRVIEFKQALMGGDEAAIDALLAEGKRSRDALGN
ncbi:MAG TPA: prephenate dehydrogenase/arogenate dehydrogenase family protein [Gemmataceae bacterium]|nr:prephenate dehydrogenase/arogenate dehydrogenase family protein [Gemmataceae bacterium]